MYISKLSFESNKIVDSLNPSDRAAFFNHGRRLVFKRGAQLFYEGGLPTGIFILQKGRVKLFKTGPYGKDQIFYIYRPGDLLGYHALMCAERYEESCEALDDCEVLFVGKEAFDQLLLDIPSLNQQLLKNLSHEFGALVNTITILAQKPLRDRLAIYLLFLMERNGDEMEVILSRQDLANIIGATRESLGRLLKEFRDEGWIATQGRKIIIENPQAIRKQSND